MTKEPSCDRCHKPVSQLEEFEGGIYKGRKLGKTYRTMYEGPAIEEHETILSEYKHEDGKDNIAELEQKYGAERVDQAFFYDQLSNTVGSSFECKYCIGE